MNEDLDEFQEYYKGNPCRFLFTADKIVQFLEYKYLKGTNLRMKFDKTGVQDPYYESIYSITVVDSERQATVLNIVCAKHPLDLVWK